jgi:hypothetical protein
VDPAPQYAGSVGPAYTPTREGHLSPIDLHHIIDGISSDKRLKFIPANYWTYNATLEAVIYDREGLLEKTSAEAVGLVYRNVGYAIHSNAKKSAWEYVDKAIRNVGRKLGAKDLIAPRSVIGLIRAVEEERVETMQRAEYDELGNTALPLRHTGYRAPYFAQDLEKIAALQPIGTMHDEIGIPDYWLRVAIAMKAVGSQGLDAAGLPEDMPWDDALCAEIRELKDKQTIDEMMHGMIALLPKIVAARLDHEDPPSPSPEFEDPADQQPDPTQGNQGDGETPGDGGAGDDPSDTGADQKGQNGQGDSGNQGQPGGSGTADPNDTPGRGSGSGKGTPGKGSGTPGHRATDAQGSDGDMQSPDDASGNQSGSTGEGAGKAPGKRAIDPDLLGKLQEETHKTSSQDEGKDLDFLGGAGEEIAQNGEEAMKDAMGSQGFEGGHSDDKTERYEAVQTAPAWPAVFGTATAIVGSIRKAIERHFLENEAGYRETGLKKGRLDVKAVIGNKMSGAFKTNVYQQRIIKDTRKYDVYILNDVSGSMEAPVAGDACDMSVFGLYQRNARWMLAARFTVALTEMLARVQGIRVGIGVHDHAYMPLKEFGDKLTADRKCFIMNQIGAFGGTDADHAYDEIAAKFAASRADKKLLIHLTDGAFGGAVANQIKKLENQGVYVAILTVGIDPSWARKFVPDDQADEINDHTIGDVLNRHFRRMIAA